MVYINIYIVSERDRCSPFSPFVPHVLLCAWLQTWREVSQNLNRASPAAATSTIKFASNALLCQCIWSLASTLAVCDQFHCSVFILLSLCFSMPVVTCYPSFAPGIGLWATPLCTPLRPHPQALVNSQDVISSTSFQPQLPGLNLRFPVAILKP